MFHTDFFFAFFLFLVNKTKTRGMSSDGHHLKKKRRTSWTQKDTKKDDLKQKSRFLKEPFYQEKEGIEEDGGCFWACSEARAWTIEPVVQGGKGSCWPLTKKKQQSLAGWSRPIREVTIKHFIFVNFFKFMVSKKKQTLMYIYTYYIVYVCNIVSMSNKKNNKRKEKEKHGEKC